MPRGHGTPAGHYQSEQMCVYLIVLLCLICGMQTALSVCLCVCVVDAVLTVPPPPPPLPGAAADYVQAVAGGEADVHWDH